MAVQLPGTTRPNLTKNLTKAQTMKPIVIACSFLLLIPGFGHAQSKPELIPLWRI